MAKLITVDRAKEEVKRLQQFINLVESYQSDTLEKQIIKEYALTNSIVKVTQNLNIEREYATSVIKSRGSDELHKLMRSMYMTKTNPNRH
ncbi:hypothetical protein [Bacillus sp. ISL-7]|uniref:hypothetical protein n=1 Tax=Bacillus sp. ISL-7 TaxID=2819136 RepID=UPI001BE5CCB3|nr:hypothetical protein [Bacillus sp. ISL-7]MBT2736551.1 hypothetical protein [Bacillus sp. ISL-7]